MSSNILLYLLNKMAVYCEASAHYGIPLNPMSLFITIIVIWSVTFIKHHMFSTIKGITDLKFLECH